MKSEEIGKAASAYADLVTKNPQDAYMTAEEDFTAGARWAIEKMAARLKIAMGALWDEDPCDGSLWLGGTALCLIRAACTIEDETPEPIPFDMDI